MEKSLAGGGALFQIESLQKTGDSVGIDAKLLGIPIIACCQFYLGACSRSNRVKDIKMNNL